MALIKCPNCGKDISTKATTCPQCGCELNLKETIVCSECGNVLSKDTKVCPNCGSPVEHNEIDPIQKEWGDENNAEESRESIIKRWNYLSNSVFLFVVSIISCCIYTYYDFAV